MTADQVISLTVLPGLLTLPAIWVTGRRKSNTAQQTAGFLFAGLWLLVSFTAFTAAFTFTALLLTVILFLSSALIITHAVVNPLKRAARHAGLKRRANTHDEGHRTNFYNENPRN